MARIMTNCPDAPVSQKGDGNDKKGPALTRGFLFGSICDISYMRVKLDRDWET